MPTDDLRLLIGRMDAKLDLLLIRHDKHEDRLAVLESWRHRVVGVAVAASAATAAAVQYAISYLTR